MQSYKTPIATVFELGNGIQKEVWDAGEMTDVKAVEEHMRILREHLTGKGTFCILIDSSRNTKMSKDIRDFLGDYKIQPLPNAVALLIRSRIARVIGSIFLRAKKTPYPMKLFTDEKKATDWLLSYLSK